MKQSLRLALVACAGFAALAFAAPALSAYRPLLQTEQSSYRLGRATTVDTFVAVPQDDDATAKISIFAPAGYGVSLSQAPGTKIGSVFALVKAKALANAILALTGDVVVGNPTDPTIAAQSQQCTGSAVNQAVWLLNATLANTNTTIPIPVFVNRVGPLTTLQVCFRSPDVPPPTGAPSGIQLVAADFTARGIFTNATTRNGYEWAGIFTPYTAGTAVPNAAGTVEFRTYVGLPSALALARAKARKGIKFVGRLSIEGVNPAGVRLELYAGKKPQPAPNATSGGTGKRVARTAKLPKTGKYRLSRPAVKVRTFFQMRFHNYVTDCTGASPSGLPVPCKGEFLAALTSNQLRVAPKRR
jgi:hypothetical protein